MARVTVQDGLKLIPNRFELVLVAANRARQLAEGAESTVSSGNDKFPVIALREIAAGNVTTRILEDGSSTVTSTLVKPELLENPVSGETGEAV